MKKIADSLVMVRFISLLLYSDEVLFLFLKYCKRVDFQKALNPVNLQKTSYRGTNAYPNPNITTVKKNKLKVVFFIFFLSNI